MLPLLCCRGAKRGVRVKANGSARHSAGSLFAPYSHPIRIKVGFLRRNPTLMRIWYDFDAILLRVEHLWRGALELCLYSSRRLWDDPKALYLAPLHVRPYGVLPSWALPTSENREKGKGWSKNALLLTIAVQLVKENEEKLKLE